MKQKIFEFITLYLDNLTQKKNIILIKKILGKKINIFFDVGAHKCETIKLFNFCNFFNLFNIKILA